MLPRLLLVFFLSFFLPLQAGANTPQKGNTFSILPFTLHGSSSWRYLQEAVPEMLKSRLTWPGHFTPTDSKNVKAQTEKLTSDQAKTIRKQLSADYLIWGTLSIVGENCSLDIKTLGPEEKQQPFSSSCEVSDLIPHLEDVARQINTSIFSRPQTQVSPVTQEQPQTMPHNPALLYNETTAQTALNPTLRYEGDPRGKDRWRSQSLNFPSRGMIVGDADGDGQKEIFLLKEKSVAVYHLRERRLMLQDEYSLGLRYECLNINFVPLGRKQKIAVSATMDNKPTACILSFADGKLKMEHERLPYFLNVIKEPPLYQPALFGQKRGVTRFLETSGIVELTITEQGLIPGRTLKLPEQGNIFNVVFLPEEKEEYKIIIADRRDKLKVYTSGHQLLATTDETYAASGTSIVYDTTFAGGTPGDSDSTKSYFIPTRLEVKNIDGDKKNELLVSRNISTAAQFFPRYRDFPQSEIHYLAWDGIGLNTVWKTRRIKGSTIDYAITDLTQKGQPELLVCVNTHPGSLGVRDKKTVLLGYPLEIQK